MHVWVSTDSACGKRGITEWLNDWLNPGWRTTQTPAVANRSLWEKLVEDMHRHARIERSRVKAHSGILLNECGDTLATKGVMNEQPPWGEWIQHGTPMDEDTDSKKYVLRDGEETLMNHPDYLEPGRTYIWQRN
jgi:ribonuclease HI